MGKTRNICETNHHRHSKSQIWKKNNEKWSQDCKNQVWPLFGHKVGQINRIVAKQELDLLSHLRNIFLKFENDTTSGAHTNVRKPGRTDGQTTPYHNTSRFSNGRIKTCIIMYLINWTWVSEWFRFYGCIFSTTSRCSNAAILDLIIQNDRNT